MGRKTSAPKAEEYAPGELEKTYAAISKADSDYFAKTYDPLLVEMRDRAAREDIAGTFKGRAGADAMQGMTGNLDIANVRGNISQGADLASGAVANMLAASTQALGAKREEQAGVLAAARGQEAATGTALGRAAKIASSSKIAETQNKQALRRARRQAMFDVASAAGSQMATNYGQTKNPFGKAGDWTYDDATQQMQRTIYNPLRLGSLNDGQFKGIQTAKQYFGKNSLGVPSGHPDYS